MYTETNFKTKKALKQAVAAKGAQVRCYSPGPFPCPENGLITLEGRTIQSLTAGMPKPS